MARKVPQKRSGLVRVFDTAEMSANFPKSRKLVKQYKFTVYADGRITKSEIKTSVKRKTSTAKRAKRKGRKQFYEIIWDIGVAWFYPAVVGIVAVGVGVWDYFNDRNEVDKYLAMAEYEKNSTPNQMPKTLRTAIIVVGVSLITTSILKSRKQARLYRAFFLVFFDFQAFVFIEKFPV